MLHEDRTRALSFGADAARYDRVRPDYPDELIDFLADGRHDVLDVGCGSGIAARQFAARGCTVLGIEPDPRMAAFARATGIAVEESQFEEWDSEEREFDLVVAAQSWHWVDPFEGASRAAHVLRPGGRAGFVWNVARHDPSIQAAFDEQYRLVGSDVDEHSVVLGRGTDDRFLVARDGLVASGMFDAPQQLEQKWTREYTTAAWLDHLPSHSDHAGLPPAELAALLDGIGQVIDDRGGSFRVTYEAVLVTALRS